jgi:hypothetical protein
MVDNPVFDKAFPTRMLANREARRPMGAPVLIGRDSIGDDLPCHVADFVVIFWTPAKHAVFDDVEFDDDLIAKMMANMASNGLILADLGG